jgi:hypothetical protein
MTPKTWTEVLIERARCEGYASGLYDGRVLASSNLAMKVARSSDLAAELYALHRCEACEGTGERHQSDGDRCPLCHGSGIAPEGDEK